jgi:hypothetical protein
VSTRLELAGPAATRWFRALFLVAALYDAVLGAAFFLLYVPIYRMLGADLPPGVASYLQLSAGFVFVQGIGYWLVYRDLLRNTDLVKVGIVYKLIYSGVVFRYLAVGQLPHASFAWFAVCDLLFIVGFVWFLLFAREAVGAPATQG